MDLTPTTGGVEKRKHRNKNKFVQEKGKLDRLRRAGKYGIELIAPKRGADGDVVIEKRDVRLRQITSTIGLHVIGKKNDVHVTEIRSWFKRMGSEHVLVWLEISKLPLEVLCA